MSDREKWEIENNIANPDLVPVSYFLNLVGRVLLVFGLYFSDNV